MSPTNCSIHPSVGNVAIISTFNDPSGCSCCYLLHICVHRGYTPDSVCMLIDITKFINVNVPTTLLMGLFLSQCLLFLKTFTTAETLHDHSTTIINLAFIKIYKIDANSPLCAAFRSDWLIFQTSQKVHFISLFYSTFGCWYLSL